MLLYFSQDVIFYISHGFLILVERLGFLLLLGREKQAGFDVRAGDTSLNNALQTTIGSIYKVAITRSLLSKIRVLAESNFASAWGKY